jgi:acetolactate synthase I/II/III large subunit
LNDDNRETATGAGLLLQALQSVGIDHLFCNLGTDHAPLIEEFARRRAAGEWVPAIVRCPHESTAAHMAGGHAFVTGRGQGVLVHVDVGTANASMAMHNLFRSRLPVLLMAGKAPFTSAGELPGSRDNYVHFVQEPYDQGALVRPFVKWEWTLPSGVVAAEALRRAHTLMHAEPMGPAHLMLPREMLAEQLPQPAGARGFPATSFGAPEPSGADPRLVERLARELMAAQRPLLVTSYGGRNRRMSVQVERLAALAGIRVFESNPVVNIGHEGPQFCGFQPQAAIAATDFGLLVDTDVPWFPRDTRPADGARWAQVDVDPIKGASPMWSFPGDLRLQGDSARILEQLAEAIEADSTPAWRKAAAERARSIAREVQARRARVRHLAEDPGRHGEINPHHLFAALDRHLAPDDIVFNEAVRNSPALNLQLTRPLPGTLMRVGGGGLGASGAMALGAKLAAPTPMMVQVVGDGSYHLNNPSAVHAVSQQYGLPILTIVVDNGGWSAVKESTLRVYPDGAARTSDEFEARFNGEADFARVAEAFGAHGEPLDDPAQVATSVARCVETVRGGRSALLHVRVTRL